MKIQNKITVALLVVGGLCTASVAENLLLDEIVVHGQKESTKQESLTMREVRESPATDVGEALKQIEGINVVRKGAIANDVVLRGFQKDNINVLIDGVRVHGACPNRMDSPAFHYDFAEVEEIRVLKGPYDLTNPGSMGGLVEAITKKPGQGFETDLNLTHGSYNRINGSAVGSYGTKKFDALAGYAYKYSKVPKSGDGKLITDVYAPNNANRYRPDTIDSKAYEIHTGWAKLGINPTSNSRTDFHYSYQDAEHVLYPYLLMDANFDRTSLFNWNFQINEISPSVNQLSVQVFWDRVTHLMDDSLRQSSLPRARFPAEYSMQSDAATETTGAKLNGDFPLGTGVLCSGIDYYIRNWDVINRRAMYTTAVPFTPLNMIPDATIKNFGIFADYEMPLSNQTKIKGGFRGDFARANVDSSNPVVSANTHKDFGVVGANLQLTVNPLTGLEVFAGVARGNRLPDQKELFLSVPGSKNSFGNPDLKPTINYEADLGAKYGNSRYYVDGSLFYSSLIDYINLRGFQTGAVSNITYENVAAGMWGGEFGTQVSLPLYLFLKGSISYAEGQNKSGNRPLSEIPPLKGTMALRYDRSFYFFEATENLTARQSRVDKTLQESETAGWGTTDLKTGCTYKGLSFYFGVYNLFDQYYFTYLSYLRDPFASGMKVPENGRNYYGTITYHFE